MAALGSGAGPGAARARSSELTRRLGLDGGYLAGELAHGHERLLGVARALATRAGVRPARRARAGIPEAEVEELAQLVRSIREDFDAGVFFLIYNMALVMGVGDRIHVLDQGRTLAEGTPAEVRANLDVTSAYLGESAVAE